MMMSIALRFIPTLIEETDKIMSAQKARGADFESGNLLSRAKALVPILVPLFISAFRRADELATAMECRCYHGGEGRTKALRAALSEARLPRLPLRRSPPRRHDRPAAAWPVTKGSPERLQQADTKKQRPDANPYCVYPMSCRDRCPHRPDEKLRIRR